MEAALINGAGRLELVEFPEPTPSSDGVVVDIDLCGICGTDIHAFVSGKSYTPAICGHEWTGIISAVGGDVTSVSEGDRVVAGVPPACGACKPCVAGNTRWCSAVFDIATGRDSSAPAHGGFAPRLGVSANRVVQCHPDLTAAQAAQVEPVTVAFHAVRHSQPALGDVVVVQGAGPIGLYVMQFALASGAGSVLVVEPNERRRHLASSLGATQVLTPETGGDAIAESTSGRGADLVYECVGNPQTIQGGVDLVRRGGRVCFLGLPDSTATIDPRSWLVKEVETKSAIAYTNDDFHRAMGMIADGRIVLDPIVTKTVGLAELGDTLAELASGESEHVKVLVDPTDNNQ